MHRRRYSGELKAQILAEGEMPGSSVAGVAMAHGIIANVLHRRRQLAREGGARSTRLSRGSVAPTPEGFVPVVVSDAATGGKTGDIQIELRRGATALAIRWRCRRRRSARSGYASCCIDPRR